MGEDDILSIPELLTSFDGNVADLLQINFRLQSQKMISDSEISKNYHLSCIVKF